MKNLETRPYVDWNKFSIDKREEPDVYLSHSQEDSGYEIFRQLSHKVAGCRYDIPWGSQVVVAYSRTPGIAESAEAIGIITFCLADGKLQHTTVEDDFMSGYFHKISFLFVNQKFQRKGVGSRLVREAIKTIRNSEIQRPIHLEGAKPAVKFFEKMGFTTSGQPIPSRRGSHLFRQCFYMQQQFGSS
ncbi:hypothetical protein BsWGS_02661 [Bradybaena similaris]